MLNDTLIFVIKLFFIVGMFDLILCSCNNHGESFLNNVTKDSSNYIDLPSYKVDFEYKKISDREFLSNLARIMGLPSMAQESDALNIRIWIWGDTGYVVNISINNLKDSCNMNQFTGKNIGNNEYVVVLKGLKNLSPRSGWPNLIDTIKKYNILFLESKSHNLKEEDFMDKMAYVQFEINHHGEYHFYKYLEPSFYRYTDTSSMKIFHFLKYLDYEFKVPAYNPAEKLFAYPK